MIKWLALVKLTALSYVQYDSGQKSRLTKSVYKNLDTFYDKTQTWWDINDKISLQFDKKTSIKIDLLHWKLCQVSTGHFELPQGISE